MLIMLLREAAGIRSIRKTATIAEGESYRLFISPKVKSPFSFGRSIYTGDTLSESEFRQVVAHESSHIRHRHPAEKTLMTILRLAMWYNPFVWMARKWLIEVHEYQADNDVLTAGHDITEYWFLILKQILGYHLDTTCWMNNSLTK